MLTIDREASTDQAHRKARFERIWREHEPRLRRLAIRLSGCPDAADDLLQDASLHAYEGFDRFRGGSSVYTWLYRITLNDVLRWRERGRRESTIDLESPEALALAAPNTDLYKSAERSMIRPAVLAAMESLPEDLRTTLVLQLYEGLKYREIASLLDIPIGTVKSRLNAAMRQLREELKDYAM